MATITYYKAVDSETDGSKGAEIYSGQVDALLPYLTSQDRITGVTQLEKFYIQSDANIDVFTGFTDLGDFHGVMIDSTGTGEVAGDVPPTAPRYGASEILANDADGCTIKQDDVVDLFRADDFILVGDVVVQIDTITANNADRVITYKFPIPYVDLVGGNATSVLKKTLVASTAVPLWVENVVAAGSPAAETYNTVPIVIVS
jgi:hypothetical protein